ncbi:MAG: histidine phosphatase family protein [Faecalibacillus sp.]
MKILYLMRHGETLFNKRKKIQGWCDSPLTELGERQALGARKYFEENHVVFDHAYSSTSERCCDTLELATHHSLPYQRLKGLKEMNFGIYEGESEDLNPPRDQFETFFIPYGGESREDVRKRLCQTCQEIMEKDDHQCVLAVSHSGACYHFMRSYVDVETLEKQRVKGFSNCCIFKYAYEDGTFQLLDVIRPLPIDL